MITLARMMKKCPKQTGLQTSNWLTEPPAPRPSKRNASGEAWNSRTSVLRHLGSLQDASAFFAGSGQFKDEGNGLQL